MKNTQMTNSPSHPDRNNKSTERERSLALLDLVEDICFAVDQDFRIAYVNRHATETFDKSAKELIGCAVNEIFPYIRGEFDFDTLRQRLSSGETLINEIQSPLSGCWYHITTCALGDEFLIFMKETTATKRYEQLLYEKDSLFIAVTNAMADFLLIVQPSGQIRYASPSAHKKTGFATDELEDKNLFNFIDSQSLEAVKNSFKHQLENPDVQASFKITMNHKDGSQIELHADAQNLISQPGVDGILLKLTS